MDNAGFAHNFTNTSALFPRDYEQKEAKMACPKRLGKPTEKYSQNCILKEPHYNSGRNVP